MLAPLRRAALGVAGGARAFTSSISKLAGNASESGSRAPAPTTAEWDNLIEQLATEEEKKEVSSLKSQLFSMHQSLQPTTEGIDSVPFEEFKRDMGEDAHIVEEIEKLYNSISFPSLSTHGEDAKPEFAELERAAEDAVQQANANIEHLQKELEKVQRDREMLKTATVDQMLENDPELRDEIDDEIERGEWY